MSDITAQVQPTPSFDLPPSAVPPLQTRPEPRPRLWPGVAIIIVQWLFILVPAQVMPDSMFAIFSVMIGSAVGVLGVLIWWLGASRLPWRDRVFVLLACLAIGAGSYYLFDPTVNFSTLLFYGFARITTAWVLCLLLTPFLSWPMRRTVLLVVLLLTWGYFDLIRFDGVTGSFKSQMSWRWEPTAEDHFLAERASASSPSLSALDPENAKPAKLLSGDWPGFRGPNQDGRLTGVRIPTDWKEHPPRKLWRHRVGPGWSSFAVIGNRLYTQEQLGKAERVVCYNADTGKEIWVHLDEDTRFTEPVAGPGPRSTPTFHDGKIYALGATGRLNCLNAATGAVVWETDIMKGTEAKVPTWGFSSSPLVAQGIVTVFVGDPDKKSVRGYKATTGDLVWSAGTGKLSYCSPQLARLCGSDQVLITSDLGLTAIHPTRGEVLWEYEWPVEGQPRIVQPALVSESDVLIGTGFTAGTRRVHVAKESDGWTQEEVWTTKAIKPYFNDLVVHKGHLYGFDNSFFTCVNLEDGKSRWRERGYDNGQVLLLADQDLLLILSETGAVALVEANPEKHKEIGRFQAIQGKTWNHPVVAHGKLFVRNGEEAACYQLTKEISWDGAGK